jgi:hypothetical protein
MASPNTPGFRNVAELVMGLTGLPAYQGAIGLFSPVEPFTDRTVW